MKESWIGRETSISFVDHFLFDFDITDSEEDFVKSSEINEWIIEQDLGITVQKFTNELKKHCILNNFTNVKNKVKKDNGRTFHVWYGVKNMRAAVFLKFCAFIIQGFDFWMNVSY